MARGAEVGFAHVSDPARGHEPAVPELAVCARLRDQQARSGAKVQLSQGWKYTARPWHPSGKIAVKGINDWGHCAMKVFTNEADARPY